MSDALDEELVQRIDARGTGQWSVDNLLSDIRGMSFSLKKRGW